MASLSAQCHNHDQKLRELTVLLQKLQVRVDQMDDGREGLSSWVKDTVGQHLQEMGIAGLPGTEVRPRSSWEKLGFLSYELPQPVCQLLQTKKSC